MIIEMNVNFPSKQVAIYTNDGRTIVSGDGIGVDWTALEQVAQSALDYSNSPAKLEDDKNAKIAAIEAQITALNAQKELILSPVIEEKPIVVEEKTDVSYTNIADLGK